MSGQGTSERVSESDDISIGDVVFDPDTDSNPAVVVNMPPKTAGEWTAYGDTTVAEDNPEYPADASIIVVAFRHEILDTQPELVPLDSPIPLRDLIDIGIDHYSFPAPRLRRADPETDDFEALEDLDITTDDTDDKSTAASEDEKTETSETDSEETADEDQELDQEQEQQQDQEQQQQQDQEQEQKLEELTDFLRDNGVRSEVDGGVVVAEKLGQNYEITLDGEVAGDGPFQDRLEQLASEYTS